MTTLDPRALEMDAVDRDMIERGDRIGADLQRALLRFYDDHSAALSQPQAGEPVATGGWSYSVNYGPEGEENWANLIAPDGSHVANIRTHHAKAIVAGLSASPQPALAVKGDVQEDLAHLTKLLLEARRVYAAAEIAGVRVEIGHYRRLREGHGCIDRLLASPLSDGPTEQTTDKASSFVTDDNGNIIYGSEKAIVFVKKLIDDREDNFARANVGDAKINELDVALVSPPPSGEVGQTAELIEAGLLCGDDPCECGETTVEECNDCCMPVAAPPPSGEVEALRDALERMITLYESEYDADAPFIRPDWLVAALSSAPATADGWRTVDTLPATDLVIAGSYNGKGQWCCEVAHVDYVREHLAKIASGTFNDSPHLAWHYSHWCPLPAAPTATGGR